VIAVPTLQTAEFAMPDATFGFFKMDNVLDQFVITSEITLAAASPHQPHHGIGTADSGPAGSAEWLA
jgi:hypothetical protein